MTPQSAERPRNNISTVSDFKKAAKERRGIELTVPSGNTCLVQRRAMQTYLSMGLIPASLTKVLQEALANNLKEDEDGNQSIDIDESNLTPEQVVESFLMIDRIVVDAVIEPQVLPVPQNEIDRDETLLYVDEIDYDDKLFIYQFVLGGTNDLRNFRKQLASDVGNRSDRRRVAHKTKRASKNKR